MPSQNGWKAWVIGILGLILLSFMTIFAGSHLDEVKDVKSKANHNTESIVAMQEKLRAIDEKTSDSKKQVDAIRDLLIGGKRVN